MRRKVTDQSLEVIPIKPVPVRTGNRFPIETFGNDRTLLIFRPWRRKNRIIMVIVLLNLFVLSVCFADDEKDAVEIYNVAVEMCNKSVYDGAIGKFDELIKKYPNFRLVPDSLFGKAECFIGLKKYDDAMSMYQTIVNSHPASERAEVSYYKWGKLALDKKDYNKVAEIYKQMVAKFPNSKHAGECYYWIGEGSFRADKIDEAIQNYSSVLKHPDAGFHAYAYFHLGVAYSKKKEYAKAIESYSKTLSFNETKNNPAMAEQCNFSLGESYYNAGKHKEAVEYYSKVSNAGNLYQDKLFGLAWAYYGMKDYKSASANFRIFAEKFPQSKNAIEAGFMQAESLYSAKDYKTATEEFDNFLKKYSNSLPWSEEATFLKGKSQFFLESYKSAGESFEKLIEKYPSSKFRKDGLYFAGKCYEKEKNYKKAIEKHDVLIKEYPDDKILEEAIYDRAYCYLGIDDAENVIKSFELLNQKFAKGKYGDEVKFRIAENYFKKGNYQESVKYLNEIVSLFPNSDFLERAYYRLGWNYFNLKDYDNAILNFKKAGEKKENKYYEEAWFKTGEIYKVRKDYANAVTSFRNVVLKDNKSSELFLSSLIEIANCYGLTGDVKNEIEVLKNVETSAKDEKTKALAVYRTAELHYNDKSYEKAQEGYRKIIDNYPKSEHTGYSLFGLGWSLSNLNRIADARSAFAKFVNFPDSPEYSTMKEEVYDWLGWSYFKPAGENDTSGIDTALIYYKKLIDKYPHGQMAEKTMFNIGKCFQLKSDYKSGAENFERLISKFPESELINTAYYEAGLSRYYIEDFKSAGDLFSKVKKTEQNPSLYDEAGLLMGECYYEAKNYKSAIPGYERAAAGSLDESQKSWARYRTAKAKYSLEDYDGATAGYRDFISKCPESEPSYYIAGYELGLCLKKAKKYEEAVTQFTGLIGKAKKWTESAPEENKGALGDLVPRSQYLIGECRLESGKYDEAISDFQTLAILYPDPEFVAMGEFGTGEAYEKKGDSENAQKAYKRASETKGLADNNEWIKRAREKIKK